MSINKLNKIKQLIETFEFNNNNYPSQIVNLTNNIVDKINKFIESNDDFVVGEALLIDINNKLNDFVDIMLFDRANGYSNGFVRLCETIFDICEDKNIFDIIKTSETFRDYAALYDIYLNRDSTIGEFVEVLLMEKPTWRGIIRIYYSNNTLEYDYSDGKIHNNKEIIAPDTLLDSYLSITARGAYDLMDIFIDTVRYENT